MALPLNLSSLIGLTVWWQRWQFFGGWPEGHFERVSLQKSCKGYSFVGAFAAFLLPLSLSLGMEPIAIWGSLGCIGSLMQRQWNCTIIPICPILLLMDMTILSVLNTFQGCITYQIACIFLSPSPFFASSHIPSIFLDNFFFFFHWLWPEK